MTTTAGSTRGCGGSPVYEVCLQGHLDARWADRLHGLTFTLQGDGTTTLAGPLADQAALHGLLAQIGDLGLPIVSISRIEPQGEAPTTMTTEHPTEEQR
jgi:hypothetical protein